MKGLKPFFLRTLSPLAVAASLLSASEAYAADVKDTLENVAGWFLNIIISVGLLMVLMGAFTFTTSGGDTQKVEKGRKYLIWGMAGVVVALLAKVIVNWTGQLIV